MPVNCKHPFFVTMLSFIIKMVDYFNLQKYMNTNNKREILYSGSLEYNVHFIEIEFIFPYFINVLNH